MSDSKSKKGKKRICINCNTKFYDLNKKLPIDCPHCSNKILEEESFNADNFLNHKNDVIHKMKNQNLDTESLNDKTSNLEDENDGEESDIISLEDLDNEDEVKD